MQAQAIFEFGPFHLDTAERLLLRDGEIVPLTPKVFDLLVPLVARHGHLLEREELLRAVWADSFVEEANLTVSVSTLRKALGEQPDGRPYIETVPKRGYRFVADVRVVADESDELTRPEPIVAQTTVEPEVETGTRREVKDEIEAPTSEPVKSQPRRRALLSGLVLLVTLAGAAYWWQAIKWKQVRSDSPVRSIAVLPLKQIGGDERDELLGFGMADVLITRLGSLNRIVVRPTSAIFKYIGVEPDVVAVGGELKVDAVLEGSIQRVGERIRVTARLVRTLDGKLLWAETFDGRLADLFAMQDKMSEQLAVTLLLKPAGEQNKLLTKRYTESTEAYQAYMKGRYFLNKRTGDGFGKAIEYFEQAIAKDPGYALAFAGVADGYSLLVNYHQSSPEAGFTKAREAATRALQLDDSLAEAHTSLAKIHHLYDWDWEAAEQEFRRAIELNPDYATTHQWYGEYLISMGRFDEAKAEMARALELDPFSPAINTAQGFPYYFNHEYDEAIAAYKKALELDPDNDNAHWRLNIAYIQKRLYDEAMAEDILSYNRDPQVQERVKAAYAVRSFKEYWKLSVSKPEAELEQCCVRYIAMIYADLGDKNNTLKWLEKAYRVRSHLLVDLKVEPLWDDLRADPRFKDLLRRMRLAP
jgi:DNA-binding winged helix-turn-helix (wHTH) protein/TolB-like protein/Flp pilus assembly protein TadD